LVTSSASAEQFLQLLFDVRGAGVCDLGRFRHGIDPQDRILLRVGDIASACGNVDHRVLGRDKRGGNGLHELRVHEFPIVHHGLESRELHILADFDFDFHE